MLLLTSGETERQRTELPEQKPHLVKAAFAGLIPRGAPAMEEHPQEETGTDMAQAAEAAPTKTEVETPAPPALAS